MRFSQGIMVVKITAELSLAARDALSTEEAMKTMSNCGCQVV